MEMYTDEKIVPESFAKADFIDGLIKQTEEMYTEHFGQSPNRSCPTSTKSWDRAWRFKTGSRPAAATDAREDCKAALFYRPDLLTWCSIIKVSSARACIWVLDYLRRSLLWCRVRDTLVPSAELDKV